MEVARCPTISGGSIAKTPISFFIQPVLKLLDKFKFALKNVGRIQGILKELLSTIQGKTKSFGKDEVLNKMKCFFKKMKCFCRDEVLNKTVVQIKVGSQSNSKFVEELNEQEKKLKDMYLFYRIPGLHNHPCTHI